MSKLVLDTPLTGEYDCGVTDARAAISKLVYDQETATHTLAMMYDEQEGEETDATERLQRFIRHSSDDTFEAIAAWLVELDGTIALAKVQAERLREVAARAKSQQAWAKDRVRELLAARGVRSHAVGTWRFGLRRGAQRAELLGGAEDITMPHRFQRTKVEHDKHEILTALKAGDFVPGYELVRGPDGVVVK